MTEDEMLAALSAYLTTAPGRSDRRHRHGDTETRHPEVDRHAYTYDGWEIYWQSSRGEEYCLPTIPDLLKFFYDCGHENGYDQAMEHGN